MVAADVPRIAAKSRGLACVSAMTALLAVAAESAVASPAQVQRALNQWTAAHPQTGAVVMRLDPTGPTRVASYKAHIPRRPASTMKVMTAASALITLGPTYRFETRLYMGPRPTYSGPILNTPLYLKGYGDPTLATPRYARRYLSGAAGNLTGLIRPLRVSGITRLRGPIVVDESYFDARRRGPGWPARYNIESQPLSAMSVNQSWLGDERRRQVKSPPLAAGTQLRATMRAMGVVQTGPVRVGRAPAQGRHVATVKSPPLSAINRLMLPPSDNYVAEMLVKNMGAYSTGAGTTAAGTRVSAGALAQYLTPSDRFVDGSGLDRRNRLTPDSLARVLIAADADPVWGASLISSLPRGNEGTLRRRFASLGGRLRAKTGYINATSGLAGVVRSRNGTRYVFAFLMNDNSISGARATQDRLVKLLASGAADIR